MALVVGENSYVDVATADTYFASRLYADGWIKATTADKEKALMMATKAIDRLRLNGKKVDLNQGLQFPRMYRARPNFYPDDVRPHNNYQVGDMRRYAIGYFVESEVSQTVKDACCEEALAMLTKYLDPRVQMQRAGITQVQIGGGGGTSETYKGNAYENLLSFEAKQLMKPLIAGTVGIV